MGTKNNPTNRAKSKEKKKYNGKEIEPVLYCDNKSKYITGRYSDNGDIICNNLNKPIPWGEL